VKNKNYAIKSTIILFVGLLYFFTLKISRPLPFVTYDRALSGGTLIILGKSNARMMEKFSADTVLFIDWNKIYPHRKKKSGRVLINLLNSKKPLYFYSKDEDISRLIVSDLGRAGIDSLFFVRDKPDGD
jgi:hypothetical protein